MSMVVIIYSGPDSSDGATEAPPMFLLALRPGHVLMVELLSKTRSEANLHISFCIQCSHVFNLQSLTFYYYQL